MISPFSLEQHTWEPHWTILSSNAKYSNIRQIESEREEKILQAVAAIGLIGRAQLSRIFFPDINKRYVQQKLKTMVRTYKLIRHEISKNNNSIPIYSLGPATAEALGIEYDVNYWLKYETKDVLKRVVFFQLYSSLLNQFDVQIYPAPLPYTGTLLMNNKMYFVYVARGNVNDILNTFKWNEQKERVIIITESLNYIQPLNAFANEIRIRVVLDNDLKEPFDKMFYKWENGDWEKTNQVLNTKIGS